MKSSRSVVHALCLAVVLCASAAPLTAQDFPKAELSGGWRLFRVEGETLSRGWSVDFAGNLNETFGIVGEVARASKSFTETDNSYSIPVTVSATLGADTYLGGVRFNLRQNARVVPFAQWLVGVAKASGTVSGSARSGGTTVTVNGDSSSSNMAYDFGGGVNLFFSKKMGARIGGSYMRVMGKDGSAGENAFRFGAGVVAAF